MVICAVLSSGCGRAPDLETLQKFQQAEQDFVEATTPDDYFRVANLYQVILDHGFVSGTVLFNQGNALMRADQRGRAIAAYQQAKRYRPRDPYLDANLRNALGSNASGAARSSIRRYVLFWQDWLSYREKFSLTTATLGLTLLFRLVARLLANGRLLKRLVLPIALFTLAMGVSTAYDWYRFDAITYGVIVQHETVARKGNSKNYEQAFTVPLAEGTEFELLERRDDWLLIHVSQAGKGWIPAYSAAVY